LAGSATEGAAKGHTGAAVNPLVQEAREDEVRLKLAENAEVDPLVATKHGLLCKLRDAHSLGVYACDFARDGKHLASCSHDCTALVWDVEKLQVRRRYVGHFAPVVAVRFSPVGTNERLATGCIDGTVKLWDKRKAQCLFTFDGQLSDPVRCVAFSPDGKRLAAGADDGTVLIWDVETAELCAGDPSLTMDAVTDFRLVPRPHFSQGHKGSVRAASFTIDGKHIVTGGDDGVLRLWRVDSNGERVRRRFEGHVGAIQDLSINKDSTLCATAGSDGTARIWVLRTGACLNVLAGHVGPAYAVAFTHDGNGRRVITGGHDHNIVVWDVRSGTVLQKMDMVHRSYVLGLSTRADGLTFASASGDRTVGVWRSLPPSTLERVLAVLEAGVVLCAMLPSLAARGCRALSTCLFGDEEYDGEDRPDLSVSGAAKVRPA